MSLVEGIAVNGEYVKNLKEKKFTIIKAPHYEEFPSMDKPDKVDRKLIIHIEMAADAAQLDWYPNKTSIKAIVKKEGYEMDGWIGKMFEFEVASMKIAGNTKQVLYVKE